MALGNAKSGPIKNNGGTVLGGGNVSATSPITQSLSNSFSGYRSGSNGSLVLVGSALAKAISAGTLAVITPGKYTGMTYPNSTIAGISSLLLAGAASFARNSENSFIGTVETQLYITTGGWSYETGQAINRTDQTDTIPTETAPTRLIPGRLTYMVTGSLAKVDSYKAKND